VFAHILTFKLFDSLQEGPKTAVQMVKGTKYNARIIKRMLGLLANHRILEMDEAERFSLNENSTILVSTAPQSLQPAIAEEFMPARWQRLWDYSCNDQ
jgi:DNA-binding IclR family transcriptional regulator